MMNRGVERGIRLLVAMGVLFLADLVQANVGPPSSGGQVVAEPVGIQEVEIRWEVLQIDLRPLAENEPAIVVAEYQLENHGPAKSLNLLFASGSAEVSQLTVSLNETPIPSHPAPETPLPESWQPPKETPGLHGDPPVSYLSYGSQPAVPYAMTVVIPEGSQKLRVQYRAEAAIHRFGQPTLYHQFAYILAPARSWSRFGGIDVTIQLPPGWSVSCNLPLQRTEDVLSGRFSEIPADAIALTTQAAVSESYGIAKEGLYWLYLLSAVFGLAFCWNFCHQAAACQSALATDRELPASVLQTRRSLLYERRRCSHCPFSEHDKQTHLVMLWMYVAGPNSLRTKFSSLSKKRHLQAAS